LEPKIRKKEAARLWPRLCLSGASGAKDCKVCCKSFFAANLAALNFKAKRIKTGAGYARCSFYWLCLALGIADMLFIVV
jgi:hypothetical protein